jgi:hypothetical protein
MENKTNLIIKIMGLNPNYTYQDAEQLADKKFKLMGGY